MKQDIIVTKQPQIPIENVQQKFELWRKGRNNRSPIPNDLWNAAVKLTSEYSITQISKALRLNYSDLKRRILNSSKNVTDPPPAFIQLDFPRQSALNEWSIEMENADGIKLKINAKSSELPDLTQFCQSFLRGCR